MLHVGDLSVVTADQIVEVNWKLSEFLNPMNVDGCFYSPIFYAKSHTWFLEASSLSSENISVGLCRHSSGPPISQNFSLMLKDSIGYKKYKSNFSKTFSDDENRSSHDILSKSELERKRTDLMRRDTLRMVCNMERTTYELNACIAAFASVESCYCKGKYYTETISSHRKKCPHRPIKCLYCSEDITLERPGDDSSLGRDFKRMLLDGRNYDSIVKVGDKQFTAHRDVLRVRSPVFESMVERNGGVIELSDCDAETVQNLLFYVYSGKVETLDQSNMLQMYYIADKYVMKGLKEVCSDVIKKSMSQANICDVIRLSLDHKDSTLFENATAYFTNNMSVILSSVEWQNFLKYNSSAANEILKSAEKMRSIQNNESE